MSIVTEQVAVVATSPSTTDVEATKQKATVKLNPKAKLKVAETQTAVAATIATTPIADLKQMEQSRIGWETTELAASNNRLYSILKQAHGFYITMKTHVDAAVRKAYTDSLQAFIAERNYTFSTSSHDMTRVVKCVFGVERRRVSAYSIALREALRQNVATEDLIQFLEVNGGVEQIRLGGTKPLTAAQRAEKVKTEVTNTELGYIKFDHSQFVADADWNDKQVVIVATYLPTGEFKANAVVKHDGAVNAALSAFYAQQNAKARADAKTERDLAKEMEATQKSSSAALNKQVAKAKPASEKRKADIAKEKAKDARIASLESQIVLLSAQAA